MMSKLNLLAAAGAFLTIVTQALALTDGSLATSSLGTLQQENLPKFLQNNPLPHGRPWGKRDCDNADPSQAPVTGVTRFYDFTISRGMIAPDGFLRTGILINNQFPGPLIEANWGDEIQVTVRNDITGPEEGTTIHWHGLLQRETPWMDGVPSITQCPIAPGSTFTYRFRADIYGTSWYHSHYASQLIDGVYGPIVIYGPSHAQFDEDLGAIMLQDYFHTPYRELTEDIMNTNATKQIQPTDNTLINGRMPFNCSKAAPGIVCSSGTPYSMFRVQTGKTYKLRLINSGAGSVLGFTIDGHQLRIISNDFVDIQPYNSTWVTLGAGQRSDVLFTPKGNGTIWMRTQSLGKFCSRSTSPTARAIIFLDNAPESLIPETTEWPTPLDEGQCANDPLSDTVPYHPMTPPEPSVTYDITINSGVNGTGHKLFFMNGSPFQANYNDPILLRAQQKNASYSYDSKYNVVNFNTNTSIRVNVWNNNSSPHPMHLHGHEMWVLFAGPGRWDGTTITNPSNPQRRDTQNLAPNGSMVIQFNADNPGTWAFHCHIAFHLSQGLFMTFIESPLLINQLEIPQVMAQTCTDWNAWSSKNVVDQIDSGVKRKRERKIRRVI